MLVIFLTCFLCGAQGFTLQGYVWDFSGSCQLECFNNPCYSNPCGDQQICTVDASELCGYKCSCPDHYYDGYSCSSDVNECILKTDDCVPDLAVCHNTNGGYVCQCYAGYSGDGRIHGTGCTDIDECARDIDNKCVMEAICCNRPGYYTCECPAGSVGDGRTDGTGCSVPAGNCNPGPCINGGTCYEENNVEKCNCDGTGYEGDRCDIDINECIRQPYPCEGTEQCENFPGGFNCFCAAGYWNNNGFCQDENECNDVQFHGNCSDYATCVNKPGSYECQCNTGFGGNGFTCTDINECLRETDNCGSNEQCSNTIGSFTCISTLVDECAQGTDNCDVNAICTDLEDGFSCACKQNYNGDGVNCDPDECALGQDNCSPNAQCSDFIGGFSCTCNTGYEGNGVTCNPILVDECAQGTDNCDVNAICTDLENGFSCTCKQNYNGDGVNCDPDECALGTDDCDPNASCQDTLGSFTCTCNQGYTGNGKSCADINECDQNPSPCASDEECENTEGSFNCVEAGCRNGYVGYVDANGNNGNCFKYYRHDPKLTADEAQANCRRDGSDVNLAKVHTTHLRDWIVYTFGLLSDPKYTWIGLNNRADYTWLKDGSVVDNFLDPWNEGEPDSKKAEELCVRLKEDDHRYRLEDHKCDYDFRAICEKPGACGGLSSIESSGVKDGICYFVSWEDHLSFNQAKSFCESRGGVLAKTDSRALIDALESLLYLDDNEYWVGLRGVPKPYHFPDGTELPYPNVLWKSDPGNYLNQCAQIKKDGDTFKIEDKQCHYDRYASLCEAPRGPAPGH